MAASTSEPRFNQRHLLDMSSLDAEEITTILDLADRFFEISERPIKKVPTLRGQTVVNLFMEPSTRTRISFEVAEKRLSADTINFSASTSSTKKGETLLDTVKNLEAMSPQILVMRHSEPGAAHFVAKRVNAAVVNAGDGAHAHPTQALLDCATIRKVKGKIKGLEIAIVGDIDHSRVARSDIIALRKLGANVRVAGPKTMIPPGLAELTGATVCHKLGEAVEGADVVMMLRIQAERQGGACLFPSTREYSRTFGLDSDVLSMSKDDAIVMHPGPMNRGVEITPEVADGPRSVILYQVTYGVAVRMAVLYLLAGKPPVE
ncbi:MAG: aspartate carbamoyltransferase catalytic subunit [Deltaproteobacteria bacterium]|nr:aspartate carbamoyltransferase catalytic subunit [Deltaproteobacteria bacterium]